MWKMKEVLERIKKARFETTDEIYKKRKEIRQEVQTFDYGTREVYKWYFYFQLCMLKNPLKELLWDYLVKDNINVNLEAKLSKEYRIYKDKCQRIIQYQRKKDREQGIITEEVDKRPTFQINNIEDLFKIWLVNNYNDILYL